MQRNTDLLRQKLKPETIGTKGHPNELSRTEPDEEVARETFTYVVENLSRLVSNTEFYGMLVLFG
jgi:hypothetical protein